MWSYIRMVLIFLYKNVLQRIYIKIFYNETVSYTFIITPFPGQMTSTLLIYIDMIIIIEARLYGIWWHKNKLTVLSLFRLYVKERYSQGL